MPQSGSTSSLLSRLNGPWHQRALLIFMVIVIAHLAEHIVQAYQVYALDWPVHQARGVLGQWFPWLVHSEALHYGYAVIMLVGIWILLSGFAGRSRTWWLAALIIQFWHHIEHALLQEQAIAGHNLFGSPVPVSIVQLWIPRVELHLLYNSLVFVPMIVALGFHLLPSAPEAAAMRCGCALRAAAPRLEARCSGVPAAANLWAFRPRGRLTGGAVEAAILHGLRHMRRLDRGARRQIRNGPRDL